MRKSEKIDQNKIKSLCFYRIGGFSGFYLRKKSEFMYNIRSLVG